MTLEASKQDNIFENIKKPIEDIISLTDKLDERYREKCFEILLNFYLHKEVSKLMPAVEKGIAEKITEDSSGQKPVFEEPLLPINVRAFLQQNGIAEETIFKLFLVEKNGIAPTYKISTVKKSEAQIQVALLAALENAITKQGNKFEFSVQAVKEECNNRSIYDTNNFKNNFKNNSKLFKSFTDEEHVELSPEGQTELADVIVAVAK
jgi:hypothetical protein